MSSPVSSRVLLIVQEALEGAVFGRVVGGVVLPAVPDDVQPCSGQDADGMGVVVAAVSGTGVEVGGPWVGSAGVAGEVGDGVSQLFVAGPAESDRADLAGLAGGGSDAGQTSQGFGGGEGARQSPISARSRAARTRPERGSDVKMWASACNASCSLIWVDKVLICSVRVINTVSSARVVWASVAPWSPVAPCGAARRRACSTLGSTRPQ